jgi:alkylhydroperoxidase family enzyme
VPRIEEAEPAQCENRVRRYLEAQEKEWGAPLTPSLIVARNPALFGAVGNMWSALGSSNALEPSLAPLVNRRVAALNGCVF